MAHIPPTSLLLQTVGQQALCAGALSVCGWKGYCKYHGLEKRDVVKEREKVPSWIWDSDYIMRGYRVERPSVCFCLCSCGCVHNESCNVWSHFIAALWFANAAWFTEANAPPRAVAMAATITFTTSAIAHSFGSYEKEVCRILWSFDRASIGLLFTVLSMCSGFQHFRTRDELVFCKFWISFGFGMLNGLMGCKGWMYAVFTFVIGMLSCLFLFHKSDKPWKNVLVLGLQMFGGVLPVLREYIYPSAPGAREIIQVYLTLTVSVVAFGAILFTLRLPERLATGRWKGCFDFVGSGHSIMHGKLSSLQKGRFSC